MFNKNIFKLNVKETRGILKNYTAVNILQTMDKNDFFFASSVKTGVDYKNKSERVLFPGHVFIAETVQMSVRTVHHRCASNSCSFYYILFVDNNLATK